MCARMYACVFSVTHPSIWKGIKMTKKIYTFFKFQKIRVAVLQSQKSHSQSYLSRMGCGETFFLCSARAHYLFCSLVLTQAGSWRAREDDGLLPASSGPDRKNPFCVPHNGVLSHLYHKRCFGHYITNTVLIVHVHNPASVPHHHWLFFKAKEKSSLQSKKQVNKRPHLSPADTNATAGDAGSDSKHIIARAGGAQGVDVAWQSHRTCSQKVKSWHSFPSKFGKVSSSPPAILISLVNPNNEIVWTLLVCSEAGSIWCSCLHPDHSTVLTVTLFGF